MGNSCDVVQQMTNKAIIDADLLEKIATEVVLRRLVAEFRELIVYSGNKEICEIYTRYIEELRAKDERPD